MGLKRVKISGFQGLDTSKGEYHENPGTSPDAVNFICRDGRLMTAPGTAEYAPTLPETGRKLFQAFFRNPETQEDERVLMASGGGKMYALKAGAWTKIGEGYASD